MPLRKPSFLARSLLPHGEVGVAAPIPADVREDLDLQSSQKVDIEYDRQEQTLTYHFKSPGE